MTNKTNHLTFTSLYHDLKEHSNPTPVVEQVKRKRSETDYKVQRIYGTHFSILLHEMLIDTTIPTEEKRNSIIHHLGGLFTSMNAEEEFEFILKTSTTINLMDELLRNKCMNDIDQETIDLYFDYLLEVSMLQIDEMISEMQGHDNGNNILASNEGFQKLKKAFQEQENIDFVREVK